MSDRDHGEGSSRPRDSDRDGRRRDERDRRSREDRQSRRRSHSRSPDRRDRSHRDRSGSRDRYSDDARRRRRERERERDRDAYRARDRDREDPRARSRRDRSSSSSSDSDSQTNSEDYKRRKRKERRREEEKEERRRRKEKKRLKKEKKSTAAVTAQWGKYGTISDIDIVSKDSEFRAWLVEEKKINPETLSKERTRKEFASFVEDFNTATLPHEKFYDMRKYDIKMNLIRSGQTVALEEDRYDPMADIRAHSSIIKSQSVKKEAVLSRAELEELRRIEAERVEVGKRRQLGLDIPRHLGVRTEEVADYKFD